MIDTNPSANNRMVLLLIGGIPVTMILMATWLWYFVAQGDGSSAFAETLAQHEANVAKWRAHRAATGK